MVLICEYAFLLVPDQRLHIYVVLLHGQVYGILSLQLLLTTAVAYVCTIETFGIRQVGMPLSLVLSLAI